MKGTRWMAGCLALLTLFCVPFVAMATEENLFAHTPETFLPEFNRALEAQALEEQIHQEEAYRDDGGLMGYYVCDNTYLMLKMGRRRNIQRMTLTLLGTRDEERTEQLLQTAIGACTPGGLEETARIGLVEALQPEKLMRHAEPFESETCEHSGVSYELERLYDGLLLCVEVQ